MEETKKERGIVEAIAGVSVFVILLAAIIALAAHGWYVYKYSDIIDTVIGSASETSEIDHDALIGYMRGLSAALMKTTSLAFSFLVTLVGALHIQRVSSTRFYLETRSESIKDVFLTIFPGLVVVMLGVALVIFSLSLGLAIN